MAKRYALATTEPTYKLGDATTNEAGATVQRFRKQVARTGTFVHPSKGWTLVLTPERLRRFVDRFQAMSANAVSVPLCEDHIVSARTNKGFVRAMEVDDKGRLFAEFEAIGNDAIAMVQRNDASVNIETDAKDGEGRSYGEAITHVALTPAPVIGGMSPAAIAAGLTSPPTYRYATDSTTGVDSADPKPGATNMDLGKLKQLLKIDADLTEENALDQLKAWLDKREADTAAATKTTADELAAAKAKIAELETKPDALKIDPDTAEDRAELIEERIDSLTEKGLPPAMAASLKTELCGKPGARPAYALSRGNDGAQPFARRMVDIIGKVLEHAVKPGEKTGPQVRSLSRDTNAPEADDSWVDESAKRMNANAGNGVAI